MCPNWCSGNVSVRGKSENVEKFCKLFIFEEEANEENSKKGKKFFARSFIHQNWKSFKKEFLGKDTADFNVDFAWSCYSCLIEGYPQDSKGECVTLEWACKKYDVEVLINTEEMGMCFEESISGNKNGVVNSSEEMPKYTCQKCGKEQSFPSSYSRGELEDEECYNCGAYGKWFDDFKEMVEEKLNKMEKK